MQRNRTKTGASRPLRLVATLAGLAAAVAGTAGILAAQGNAAPAGTADAAAVPQLGRAVFKLPRLKNGLIAIRGTNRDDRIALRLEAGDPGVLEVDAGDDGSADSSFSLEGVAKIVLDAGPGNDVVRIDESNGIFTDHIATTIGGGPGNDRLSGGSGAETLRGGSGNDSIDGNRGNDLALMGQGDDTFFWDPGDGSDTIEGEAGADTMLFNGAGAAEHVDLTANGRRLLFTRDVAGITMDTSGVERVLFRALGGADVVTVNDLSATDVNAVDVDLAGAAGGGDGAADSVVVNGTNGDDAIDVSGDAGEVKVSGLAATVAIFNPEVANDRLQIDTLAGKDSVDSAGLAAGAIQLFVNGVLVP
jgi:Ca2+-binding RTX toxin-like protein